jgi:nitrogenase molybdenum-iron protein NifN
MPIGIKETDKFIKLLEQLSHKKTPRILKQERGRLVDAYIDGHKYLFGKKAVVFGDEDLVISLVSFLSEIGIHVSLAASGGRNERFRSEVMQHSTAEHPITARNNYTFDQIDAFCEENKPDILVGNSKGYYISRKQGVPLIRVGFPIHDRIGAQRTSHLGYKGTQALFDRVVNTLLSYKQEHSPVGYKYM